MIRHNDALNAKRFILLCSSVTHTRNAGLGWKGIFSKECKMKTITASAISLYVHWTQDFIGVLWSTGVISLASTESRGVVRYPAISFFVLAKNLARLERFRTNTELALKRFFLPEIENKIFQQHILLFCSNKVCVLCKTKNLQFKPLSTAFDRTPQFWFFFTLSLCQ